MPFLFRASICSSPLKSAAESPAVILLQPWCGLPVVRCTRLYLADISAFGRCHAFLQEFVETEHAASPGVGFRPPGHHVRQVEYPPRTCRFCSGEAILTCIKEPRPKCFC